MGLLGNFGKVAAKVVVKKTVQNLTYKAANANDKLNENAKEYTVKFELYTRGGVNNHYRWESDTKNIKANSEENVLERLERGYGRVRNVQILSVQDIDKDENYEDENPLPEDYDELLKQGKAYYNNKEYEEAIKYFQKAAELNPDDEVNLYWLGCSYNRNKEYDEAIKFLIKAVELNPDDETNWSWLGASYNMNGDYEEAIRCLNKATELNPDNDWNWAWLGNSYNKNCQFKEAKDIYNKLLENNKDNKEIIEKLDFIKDSGNISKKSWKVALILAIILPSFHRFYAGKIFTGIIDLIILIVSFNTPNYYVFGFFYLIDIFFLLIGKFKDKNGKYIIPY